MYSKKILTIPNILSFLRIILAVLFFAISFQYGIDRKRTELVTILLISALTDFLDGKIARKFNMISEFGKLIDPIADKLTQGVLLLSVCREYTAGKIVFILFMIKETYMCIMGLKTIAVTGYNDGAMWYGKINTIVFYAVMVILFLFPAIPDIAGEAMITVCGIFMTMALVLYAKHYKALQMSSNKDYEVKR